MMSLAVNWLMAIFIKEIMMFTVQVIKNHLVLKPIKGRIAFKIQSKLPYNHKWKEG